MGFTAVEFITKRNAPPEATISYLRPNGRGKNAGKAGKQPELMIVIPTTICGVAKAKAFVMMIGSGEHAGKLRIKGTELELAGVKPRELKHAFVWRFGHVPMLGDEIFDSERRPVTRISDNEYEIDVPVSWFTVNDVVRPSPPAPKKK